MIDLHVHSRCSDGRLTVKQVVAEAKARNIKLLSITDHDSISCQREAATLSARQGIRYVSGVELNITFFPPEPYNDKPIPLDLLGYRFDSEDKRFADALKLIGRYRKERADKIIDSINAELRKEGTRELTKVDRVRLLETVDGVLGRPHIANYLVKQGIVATVQEAFDKYLVKCNVPKYPLRKEEASKMVRNAGGITVLAHPNDPHGTSLVTLSKSLKRQVEIIEESLLEQIDGVECWHSRSGPKTTSHYISFAEKRKLVMTGGSDCHQKPIIMGTVKVPSYVSGQFSC